MLYRWTYQKYDDLPHCSTAEIDDWSIKIPPKVDWEISMVYFRGIIL